MYWCFPIHVGLQGDMRVLCSCVVYIGDRMSKTTLGQKSLGLTVRMFLASGLVLSITQSLDERGMAGKSMAELRQEAWTKEIIAGHKPQLRGGDADILAFQAKDDELVTGSMVSQFRRNSPQQAAALDGAVITLAATRKGQVAHSLNPATDLVSEDLAVNRAAKGRPPPSLAVGTLSCCSWSPRHCAELVRIHLVDEWSLLFGISCGTSQRGLCPNLTI